MLKQLSLTGAFFLLCSASYGQKAMAKPAEQVTVSGPAFSLTNRDSVFDFCEIEEGDVVKHQFLFRNNGTEPLIISNIHTAVPNARFKWPSRLIKPGKTGIITVTYSSFMDVGPVAGDILITSNATKDPATRLHIKGKVMEYNEHEHCCGKDKGKAK